MLPDCTALPVDIRHFWLSFDYSDVHGCWPWQRCRHGFGYGELSRRGKHWRSHVLARTLAYGPVPRGVCVCHRCDNPPCGRPDHLILAPRAINVREAFAKGRRPGGPLHGVRAPLYLGEAATADALSLVAVSVGLFVLPVLRTREERFWDKVDRSDPEGCWPWLAGLDEWGYGWVNWRGRGIHATRVAYTLTYGTFDPALKVCHTCDNPICCRPSHLWLGTDAQNAADRATKGRNGPRHPLRGPLSNLAVLTEAQASEIVSLSPAGRLTRGMGRQLAARFGVSEATVSHIVHGTSWAHLRTS